MMKPKHEALIEELKNLHRTFARVGMLWDELDEENDTILDNVSEYPFDIGFHDVTADVADWVEAVTEKIQEQIQE